MFDNFNVVSAGAKTFSFHPRPYHTHTLSRGAGLTTPQLFLSRRETFSTLALSLNLFLRSPPPPLLSSSNLRLRVTFISLTAVLRFDGGGWAQPLGPREIEFQFFLFFRLSHLISLRPCPCSCHPRTIINVKGDDKFYLFSHQFFPLLAMSRTSGVIGGGKKKITDFDRLLQCRSSWMILEKASLCR